MWISKQLSPSSESFTPEIGQVTISSQSELAVCGDSEKRSVIIFAPFGYQSVPSEGQQALLFSQNDKCCCAGFHSDAPLPHPGEIKIVSPSGAYIYLKNDGEVEINGLRISPQGELITSEV